MKLSYIRLSLAGSISVLLMTACGGMMKKTNDIPVTTSSTDAMESFHQGLMSLDQNDTKQARTYFMKAIEQDPKLAIAYLYKSGTDQTPK